MKGLTVIRSNVGNLEEANVILSDKPDSWFIDDKNYIRLMDNQSYGLVNYHRDKTNGTNIVTSQGSIPWIIEEIDSSFPGGSSLYNSKGNCYIPPAGYYLELPSNNLKQCPAGSYCPIGTIGVNYVAPCPAGSYCPAGSSSSQPCPAGSYCTTPSSSQPCPAGSYCPIGSTNPQTCQPGYYYKPTAANMPPVCTICPENTLCTNGVQEVCPNSYCPPGSVYNNNIGYPYDAYDADYGNVAKPYVIKCVDEPIGARQQVTEFQLVIFISPQYTVTNKNVKGGYITDDFGTNDTNNNTKFIDSQIFKTGITVIKMRQSSFYGPWIILSLYDKKSKSNFDLEISQNHSTNPNAYAMIFKYNNTDAKNSPVSPNPTNNDTFVADRNKNFPLSKYVGAVNIDFSNVSNTLKVDALIKAQPSRSTNWCSTSSKIWISSYNYS
jgi:hypothetical protein